MITSASKIHIEQVVKIHCASLPYDFLPQLGQDFLSKTFYPAVITSNQAEFLIDTDESGNVTGFIIVTLDSGKFLLQIIKDHFWSFAATGIRSSMHSLKHFQNNIQILFSSTFSNKNTHPVGEIYIIAVDESLRGKGIGASLVNTAEDYLQQHSITAIKIKTRTSNKDWISFFKKSGWSVIDQFNLIGNNYTVLQKYLCASNR